MLTLFIETSTDRGGVAISDGESLLFHKEMIGGFTHSKFLLSVIQEGLQSLKIEPKQLQLIAVGIGPGSYTGIRLGALVAKTFAFAAGIPLVGICTLKGFIPSKAGKFAAIIDAKIGGAYVLTGEKSEDVEGEFAVTYTSEPQVYELSKLEEIFTNISCLVTPQKEPLASKIASLFPKIFLEWEEKSPNPLWMVKMAINSFNRGQFSKNGSLDLLYLRKTQAEIEKENKEPDPSI